MNNMDSNYIRNTWLKFFKEKDHLVLPSQSLIPNNDKSLLWINSGVATLKSYFDGSQKPPYSRLTNSQKAIRTGDIENVGITIMHHTFFEMLGNFSIGDYFKEEAINMAWELLTSENFFNIDKNLLYITVFEEDEDSLEYWLKLGISKNHIFKMGRETNFWDMGKGPCGPSSEIFFDKGKLYDERGAEELIKQDIDNDRYVEIWNIVFSQFNNDGNNNYKELPQKNIDTGAGLERLTSILQNTPTNFETDLFKPLIEHINSKTNINYLWQYVPQKLKKENKEQFFINAKYKAIADFIRSSSFAISDGANPGPNGRGYIIRKLIRKAVINKIKLGIKENFLHELVDPLIKVMGEQYPLLKKERETIIDIITNEEVQFNKTLLEVNKKLENVLENNELDERFAFKLHETYGLPMDSLKELSENSNIKLDWNKIKKLEVEFKKNSKNKKASVDAMNIQDESFVGLGQTNFTGREEFSTNSEVLFVKGDKVVFDKTPFYATSGGQESDFGYANEKFVSYVRKNAENTFIHEIKNHNFKVGDNIKLKIDMQRRKNLTVNHSAAHLLFRAIEIILGKGMEQLGSKIEEDFLRFDFPLHEKMSEDELYKVEELVNKWINDGTETITTITDDKTAKSMAISRVEGHEYGDKVRVVKLNHDVIDLCGGTHVKNTSEIEKLKIINFEKKGSGVWRIEAIAGNDSIKRVFNKINAEFSREVLDPTVQKINNFNNKLSEININTKLNFDNELNHLNLEDPNFKNKVKILSNKVHSKIIELSKEINSKLVDFFRKNLNECSIFINKFNNFNTQELTKPLLSVIDNTKTNIVILITEKKDKCTYSFVIPRKNISKYLIKKIQDIAKKFNLRGNGKDQLFIFGGKKFDNDEMIEEIKKWEF